MSKYMGTSTKKRRQRAGFTFAEVLLVAAIIAILAGFVGVSAVSMYRNVKQTQLDKTAETIFHAAQNRLSELYAYGKEDVLEKGNTIDASKKLMYISSSDVGNDAYLAIMEDNTVSSDILSNMWAIEYQASTCRVLNVVYAEENDQGIGSFGRGINGTTTLESIIQALIDRSFDGRKNKFGWYGDKVLADLQQEDKQVGNTSVDVDIVNEENLYAHVRVSVGWEDNLSNQTEVVNFLNKVSINLTIMDATTGGAIPVTPTYTIPASQLISGPGLNSKANGFYNGKSDADDGDDYLDNKYLSASWDILLDTLYDNAFTGSDNTVKTVNGHASSVTPGDNFYLIAKLVSNEGVVPEVQDYDVDNSLFAAYSDGKAYIEYGRHLQNIGNTQVTGLNAVQIADIDFNSETAVTRAANLDEFNKYWLSVYPDVSSYTNFLPKNSTNLSSYDGQNHIIRNLDINQLAGTGSGIFGELTGVSSIKNVIITDSKVDSGAATAGMFAAKISSGFTVAIENCYLNNVSVDGASSANLGGFLGEIASTASVTDCGVLSVDVGNTSSAGYAGAFAGLVTGQFSGRHLYVFGGKIDASTEAGGIIGYSHASANLTLNGCRVSGAEITSSSGNAGGLVGNSNNTLATIGTDSAVAGSTVRASSGDAGGFIGYSSSIINISDSEYYMPASSESGDTAGVVSLEFAGVIGNSGVTVTYNDLKRLVEFKYVHELKPSLVFSLGWINGGGNAGGLVGASNKNITVSNTFATGVLSSTGYSGGFVGNTTGVLSVTGSYTDFYISGKNVGGFAAGCGSTSNFNSCYTAGFLVGNADNAGGFAPVTIGTVTNSYTVFNFDNVADTSLFAGTAQQDEDHQINSNGTISNYPTVTQHSYYPVAPVSGGVAYYVYSETTFEATDNAVSITASELANNKKENETASLLSGSFNKGQGVGNTVPYSLSSFFGATSILQSYPFPALKVNKIMEVGAGSVETVLKHHNDWLIIDSDKTDIEVWYMMYNDNMTGLETKVAGIGNTGIKLHRKVKAVRNGASNEYQINVGSREVFSGYKFVGYFDPDTASAPLTSSSAFDRSKKFDYVSNNINGDIVVQTSISDKNVYGYQCASHNSIFDEDEANTYKKTRRIYAVYRLNKPYIVTLSHREYKLPKADAEKEESSLEDIYTKSSKLASDDLFEVTYTSPVDAYKFIYADQTAIRDKVGASHSKLASDEELTEDYIAEMVLAERFPNANTYKEKLAVLDDIRAGKKVTLDDGTIIAASDKNQITRKVDDFTDAGYELLDFDKLLGKELISGKYYQNVTETRPIYSIVRIDPAKDADGNTVEFKDRVIKNVDKDNDGKITISTNKTFDYVILYNTNKSGQILNLIFRNTAPNEDNNIPYIDNYRDFCRDLAQRPLDKDASHVYQVKVSADGFKDIETSAGRLSYLMKPEGHPTFEGFTLTDKNYDLTPDRDIVTLYYDRNRYTLSAKFDGSLIPHEQYKSSTTEPSWMMYYGQSYQDLLWEIASHEVDYSITGGYSDYLKTFTGTIYIYFNENDYYRDDYETYVNGYNGLVSYILNPKIASSGDFILEFYVNRQHYAAWSHWSKTGGDTSYAFTREGFVLSGFKIFYKVDGQYVEQSDLESESIEDLLSMPDCDVRVEPQWVVNPKYLRVEIYYQSPYDDIAPARESDKQYELYKGTTLKVNNGIANQMYNAQNQLVSLANPIPISELLTKESTGANLINYLEPYYRNNIFFKKAIHNLNGSVDGKGQNFNPYVPNAANTKQFGTHHFAGSDTMIVALYYDLTTVEYRFHFITRGTNNDAYSVPNNTSYKIRSQWDDFKTNSNLYNYSGDLDDHTKLKQILQDPHNVATEGETDDDDYVKVGLHAMVKAEINRNDNAAGSTEVTYGGLNSNNRYEYDTGSVRNGNTIKYGVTVYYKALYGAPAIFSSDGDSLIPWWYLYKSSTGTPTPLQQYVIGGSSSGTTTIFNDYSLKYFGDVTTATAAREKDLYPNYPGRNAGTYYFYLEVDPNNLPTSTWTNYRTLPSQNANINMFNRRRADIETVGKSGNVVFWTNGDWRKFVDGYSTFGYSQNNDDNYTTNIPKTGDGGDWKDIHIYLKRNTYNINFVDAELTDSNFATSYLYRQQITALPSSTQISGNAGSDYVFDGWYTSSIPSDSTKIADSDGHILLDNCEKISSLLVENDKLLMNHEDMQIFANWAPSNCNVKFNPFYPDNLSCGVDSDLTITPNPVPYGNTISTLPTVKAPYGDDDYNYIIETRTNTGSAETDGIFYVIKTKDGEIIGEYKFLGWYKYIGADTPSSMDDLKVEFKENESLVTGHMTLYAKWQTITEKTTYTITCRDFSDGNKEIFRVERYAAKGTNLTVNPPLYTDKDTEVSDKDVHVYGSYDNLLGYEPLTGAQQVVIENGLNITFLYDKAPEWRYIVKACVNIDGTDIVISTNEETTTYALKQIIVPSIMGYSYYQYQVEGAEAVTPTDTSASISVLRPEGTLTEPLVITIRYHLDTNILTAKSAVDYSKYDPLDLVEAASTVEIPTGETWQEALFAWNDATYAPAIHYTVESVSTYEYIGNDADSAISAQAAAVVSNRQPNDYTVTTKLVAVNKSDSSDIIDIQSIGSTTVSISKSSYSLEFDPANPSNQAKIYYASAGSNIGNWYWDEALAYRIGADGSSIVTADISDLPTAVKTKAQKVQEIITATLNDQMYKSFFFIKGTTQAYTVVDNFGKLRNGNMMDADKTAYVEGSTSGIQYTIDLYDSDGNPTGQIDVWVP
ncbi:type II secretion system protein [Butyrivibrio sp. FCS014]|uniref:type II secretion system protein n=1 Tax=Butyrivibrio sp. FCS014 TaxID=1408304 RepID=UPI000467AA63|nr:type II secretion system protein [Butyrivibrio sp. FCS014]